MEEGKGIRVMRCREARKMLSRRFDGELDEVHRRAVKEHLAGCPGCQRFADDLPLCSQALDLVAAPEPRADFTIAMLARLLERRTQRVWVSGWVKALHPGAVAAVAMFCGVVMALSVNGEQDSQVSSRKETVERLYAQPFDPLPGNSAGARYLALLLREAKD